MASDGVKFRELSDSELEELGEYALQVLRRDGAGLAEEVAKIRAEADELKASSREICAKIAALIQEAYVHVEPCGWKEASAGAAKRPRT